MMLPSISILLPGLLVVPAIFVGLFFGLRRKWRGKRTGDEPTCAKCGYITRGLVSNICPECGTELVGLAVVPPRSWRELGFVRRWILWTVLAVAPLWIVYSVATSGGYYERGYSSYAGTPRSAAYREIWVAWPTGLNVRGWLFKFELGFGINSWGIFEIPRGDHVYARMTLNDGRVVEKALMLPLDLKRFYAECGLDVTREDIQDEILEMSMPTSGTTYRFGPIREGPTFYEREFGWIRWVYWGAAILIYFGGWWWVERRRRVRLARSGMAAKVGV